MEKAAAIDIGSNAIRLVVGSLDAKNKIQVFRKMREPVRLGQDVFEKNLTISADSIILSLKAFEKFKKVIDEHGIKSVRAVATSAVRDSANGKEFAEVIHKTIGIPIDIIDGIEEARLIQRAVQHELALNGKRVLILDIGGGSVETTIVEGARVHFMESYRLGTVRLLKAAERDKMSEESLERLIGSTLRPLREKIDELSKKAPIEFCIGTGGNVECLGVIRAHLFNKNSISKIYLEELEKIIRRLESMSFKDRVEKWNLRPDRADVIYPASLVVRKVMKISRVETMLVPRVGLRDGILLELFQKK